MNCIFSIWFQIVGSYGKYCRAAMRRVNSGLILALTLLILASCGQSDGTQRAGVIPRAETVTLPTKAPTLKPSPMSTRVMPVDVLTPPSPPTITPIPDEALGLVVDVIDGNIIAVVMDGDPANRAYKVRYLGIEAPENSSVDPWGVVAYETNHKLTNLKVVRLVRDKTDFDDDGYLLRYVYVGNQMMSIILTEQGLAKASIEKPDTRFEEEILEAEARAKEGGLGLWGQQLPTPTSTPAEPAGAEVETTAQAPVETLPATAEITSTLTVEPTEGSTVITGTATVASENTPEPTTEASPELLGQ